MKLEERIQAVLKDPHSISKRAALASSLSHAKHPKAHDVWLRTIQIAISAGDFFNALALIRLNLPPSMIPSQIAQLAQLFARRNPPPPLPTFQEIPFPSISHFPNHQRELLELAYHVGIATVGIYQPRITKIPPMPIFNSLSGQKFITLAEHIEPLPLKDKQFVVRQGSTERSFYILSHGKVDVIQHREHETELILARVSGPTVIGEMALLTNLPRRASVITNGPSLVWRISPELLSQLTRSHPELINQIRQIIERRQLQNLIHSSELLKKIEHREKLLSSFSLKLIEPDTEVIPQGAPPSGLFVILHGEAIVFSNEGGRRVHVADLQEGDLFGEISLLTGQPTSASVWMPNGGVLLHLPTQSFHTLKHSIPQLEEELRQLMKIRKEKLQDLLTISPEKMDNHSISWLQSTEFKL